MNKVADITQELLFIKKHAFRGMFTLIGNNLGVTRDAVHKEMNALKEPENYNYAIINEARRLLRETKGLEYKKQ